MAMDLTKKFKWKTSNDEFLEIQEMDTKHLFYTFKMIWNHVAPEHMRIWYNRKYVFGEFYTKKYFKEAVENIYRELGTRNDLGPKSMLVLLKIEDYIREYFEGKV